MDGESSGYDNLESILQDPSSEPCNLPLEYLRKITNDFSDERLLGEGGFGKVYKGVLQSGKLVAVKKLETLKPGVQEKQFENEVYHLMRLKHPNIVRFVGYCYETQNECLNLNGTYIFAEKQQRLLCLEYLPNGSLDEHLSDISSGLDWETRYIIIKGICCGIHYLHDECQSHIHGSIIHLDLKPANILLDDNMVPKVADFGLSRLFDDKKTQTCTTNLAGSFGYMAPEYMYGHVITSKADIYSLGVIIIEIITGDRIDPFSFNITSCQDFAENVLKSWRNRFKTATSETYYEQIKCCLEIGLSCLNIDRNERPTTREIIKILRWEITSCYVNSVDRPPTDEENQDTLIMCIRQDLGFSNGRPVAACIMYRCLLYWRSFEVETTSIFDRIIEIIGSAIEANDNKKFAYWFSVSSALLLLLLLTLKTTGAAGLTPQRRRSSAASFGSVVSGFRASPQSAGRSFLGSCLIGEQGDLRHIEAKYPALHFKDQLITFLQVCYRKMRDNMKNDISAFLGFCVQALRTSSGSQIEGSHSHAALPQQNLVGHWQSIVRILTNYLNVFKANYVPAFLIMKMFTQVFGFINVQLFNGLLVQDRCSFSNGEYVRAGLTQLEQWCTYVTEEYAGNSWNELIHIRQAAGFLVIRQKQDKTLEEITRDLCPALNIKQLHYISTAYWDDKYGTQTVSSDVITGMEIMREDSNNAVGVLLEDDNSIPFSMDDISKGMTEFEVTDVELPPLIRKNPGFAFLCPRED